MTATLQAKVEAQLAQGTVSPAAIARTLGINYAYVRACCRRARLYQATGRKSTPEESAANARRKADWRDRPR